MTEQTHKIIQYGLIALALCIALVGSFFGVALPAPEIPAPADDFGAQSAPSAGCYREAGGNKWICQSGGEFEFQSGSTLDVQSGASLTLGGYVTSTLTSLTVTGPITSGGKLLVTDQALIDGDADEIQLTVQGYTTQTTGLFVLETSAGTDKFTVSNAGNTVIAGTLDVAGASLNYGPNDLYPVGASSSGFELVWGSDTITGTAAVVHGLTTPTVGVCSLGQAPGANGATCAVVIAGATVTVGVYLTDTTASAVGVPVYWQVIGLP